MTAPGRNDPCFCGSGKKFKRCCATISAPAEITDSDRALAYDVLDRMTRSRRFADDFDSVLPLLHDEDADVPGPLDNPDDGVAIARALDWFAFDVPSHTGRTLGAEALRTHAGELTAGARRFIADMCDAPLRFMQVRTVLINRIAVCVDVLEPSTSFRIDAPIGLARHDLLIARIVERGLLYEIEGEPGVLPPEGKRIVRDLKRIRREAEKRQEPPALLRMIQAACLIRLMTVFDSVVDEALHVAGGDAVQPAAAYFVVHDQNAVLAAIEYANDIVRDRDGASGDTAFVLLAAARTLSTRSASAHSRAARSESTRSRRSGRSTRADGFWSLPAPTLPSIASKSRRRRWMTSSTTLER